MQNVYFFDYKGKKILFVDYSKKSPEEEIQAIEEARKIIRQERKEKLLVLTDVTDGRFNMEVSKQLKELTKNNAPYVKKSAVVGIKGMRKVIYDAILKFTGRTNFASFHDHESAKEWLIKESE